MLVMFSGFLLLLCKLRVLNNTDGQWGLQLCKCFKVLLFPPVFPQPASTGDDRAMCFTCSVCLVCWEPTDEPW